MQRLPVLGSPPSAPTSAPSAPTLDGAELARLERRLHGKVGDAIVEHQLIEAGDKVMVCVSGGKDSYALLDLLLHLQRRAPIDFSLVAVNVDQGWPGYATDVIAAHLQARGVAHRMVQKHEIAAVVERVLRPEETGATPCSLCSRLRRGVLYGLAEELGATKIALGHHLDDLCETLLLNLFFGGQLSTMPARLTADDGKNVVIRPMVYVEERDLVAWAGAQKYPVVRCSCPTCGLPDQQRQVLKRLLTQLATEHPGLKSQMLAAMKNVRPSHLLDRTLSQVGSKVGSQVGSKDGSKVGSQVGVSERAS